MASLAVFFSMALHVLAHPAPLTTHQGFSSTKLQSLLYSSTQFQKPVNHTAMIPLLMQISVLNFISWVYVAHSCSSMLVKVAGSHSCSQETEEMNEGMSVLNSYGPGSSA